MAALAQQDTSVAFHSNNYPNELPAHTHSKTSSHRNSLSHLTAKINLPESSLGKTRQANAVVTKPNWQRILNKVEQDIKRALAVMDHDSGKMMNYHQLRKHPKFNKAWATSSANKFGRLASGVGGRVKGMKII